MFWGLPKDSSDQLFRTPFIRPKILTKVPTQQKYISFIEEYAARILSFCEILMPSLFIKFFFTEN